MKPRFPTFPLVAVAFSLLASFGCVVGDPDETNFDEDEIILKEEQCIEPQQDKRVDSACCGNDQCERGEDAVSCARDCARCGDGMCSTGESPSNCSIDCGTCGNGVCGSDEGPYTCAADCALPSTVRVDKVRYCRSWPFCRSANSYPEYEAWHAAGVKNDHQKKTFLAKAADPPRAKVRHLVFLSSGQATGLGARSDLTGQRDGWENPFTPKTKSKYLGIDRLFAHNLTARMGWTPDETFVGLAFDAHFNHEFSKNEKTDIETAYFNWLKGKFNAGTIKSIYLGGHSRGGCLAARLGKRFTAAYPNVPVIVQTFDPVCARTDGLIHSELGVTSQSIQNPLKPGWGAYKTNLTEQFPNRSKLAFLNQVSGDLAIIARAFTHHTATAPFFSSGGSRPWLEQRWWPLSHVQMDNIAPQNQALDHVERNCAALGCD